MIYLDFATTTPCAPEVIEAMKPYWSEKFGNPSSSHYAGRFAKQAVRKAREQVAELINCNPAEIFFTSGATESNNILFLGLLLDSNEKRRKIAVSVIEHKAVLAPAKFLAERGFDLIQLPVTKGGVVDVFKAEKLIDSNTALVSVQAANNEIGTIQPVKEIAEISHIVAYSFHTDAVQSLGKIPFDVSDIDSDFAEMNKISTTEWKFKAVVTNLMTLANTIYREVERWYNAISVNEQRGSVIYTYVGQNSQVEIVIDHCKKILRKYSQEHNLSLVPIIIVILKDCEGLLGQDMAEMTVLESLSPDEKSKFGSLVESYRFKLERSINQHIETMLKEKIYTTGLKEELHINRLSQICTKLFNEIYKHPISFPFDGFTTASGNAADSCASLTIGLLNGSLDYYVVMGKPVKEKNRAINVLVTTWSAFLENGKISKRPAYNAIKSLTIKWDDILRTKSSLSLKEMFDGLISPPYGANIASACLILGVYISPRASNLQIQRKEELLTINQWLGENCIKYKNFNIELLEDSYLIYQADQSSEWENLLNEWELCEDHLSRKSCLIRVLELKKKLPIPPSLIYKEQRFNDLALESIRLLDIIEGKIDEAIKKIEAGKEKEDVSLLAWGASDIKKMIDRMEAEKPKWTVEQLSELNPYYENSRQLIIQLFPEWIKKQEPRSDEPDKVGGFRHKMVKVVGKSLDEIGLDTINSELKEHVKTVLENIDIINKVENLLIEVQNWLIARNVVIVSKRVIDIISARKSLKEYKSTFLGLSRRVRHISLVDIQEKLNDFESKLNESEKAIELRLKKLSKAELLSIEAIENLNREIDSLNNAYDDIPEVLGQLSSLKKCLSVYRLAFSRLGNEELSWEVFESLIENIGNECQEEFKNLTIPWSPEKTINSYVKIVAKERMQKSKIWVDEVLSFTDEIPNMQATEVNQLHNRLINHPAYITATDLKKIETIKQALDKRENEIKIEVLIEKFKELSIEKRKEFLKLAGRILEIR